MIQKTAVFMSAGQWEAKGFIKAETMKKILIVDDSAFMRKTMKDILHQVGYEVVGEAESGEEALEKYKALKPDLVTMDMVMLGAGGTSAVKKILSHDVSAKILMVSAMGQEAMVTEAIQIGAKGFIVKPFKPEQLVAEVKGVVG